MIQNAAAQLDFNEPKRAHVTPLSISLNWLPVAAWIKFKTLMLAYRTATGSAPSYFHSLLKIYIPSRSLRSMNEQCLVDTSQRGTKSLSRTFSFTIPGWWNNLPTPLRNAESLTSFFLGGGYFFYVWHMKTHLFPHPFDFIIKKNIYLLSLSLISPCLACTNLNNAWNLYCKHFLLLVASLWLYFSILDICIPQLWIKASAKWINVNINILFPRW